MNSAHFRTCSAFGFFLILPILGAAQTVDPRIVEFIASADHNTTLPSGEPSVAGYQYEVYNVGASAPFQTTPIGKPTPDATGLIAYDFSGQVAGWPLPGGIYEMRVSAVGPLGIGRSTPSNSFTLSGSPPVCTYAVSPTTVGFPASGGGVTVTVTASGGCGWTASAAESWLSVAPMTGTDAGAVTITASANPGPSTRAGSATIAGQPVTVTQAAPAASCYSVVSPTNLSAPGAGASLPVIVHDEIGCPWAVTDVPAWITATPMTGTATGSNQTVTLVVAANPIASPRSAHFGIANRGVDVSQAAGAATCTYSLTPASSEMSEAGGSLTLTMATQAGCSWTAASPEIWLSFTAGPWSGPGTLTVTVAANTSLTSRTGTVTAGGQSATITQAAAPPLCTYALTPMTADVGSGVDAVPFTVTAPDGCAWSAMTDQSWVTLGPMTGTGTGVITAAVTPNGETSPRTATLTVAGQIAVINQAAAATCTQVVTPTTVYLDAAGGFDVFTVSTGGGCAWTASESAPWLSLAPTTGTGPGTVTATATANGSTTTARNATVTIGDATVVVSQPASIPATPRSVVVFQLVDAATGQVVVSQLLNGSVLILSQLPTQDLNLRAVTDPATVGSVKFVYDSLTTTDNTAPYELTAAGGWKLKHGSHTIKATPYPNANGSGAAGYALTVKLLVKK